VKNLVSNLLSKLGVRDRTQLAILAQKSMTKDREKYISSRMYRTPLIFSIRVRVFYLGKGMMCLLVFSRVSIS